MASIPPEIWIHVAQFIPQATLCDMLNVNGIFYQLAMDARYREVTFVNSDRRALKRLRRLRDSVIAHRVRCLHINASSIWDFAKWFSQGTEFSFFLTEVIQAITDTVTYLTGITDFSVTWTSSLADEHLLPVLAVAWETFGSNLQKLAFTQAPFACFSALLSTAGHFMSLRDLQLGIRFRNVQERHEDRSPALATILAQLVNKVAPNLRNPSLTSWGKLELLPLFRSIGNIPHLVRLTLSCDFDKCGLSEPLGLTRIFRNHAATLRHVEWTTFTEILTWDTHWDTPSAMDPCMVSWLNENKFDESILSNLLTLRLPVPGPASVDLTARYIRRSVGTLTSLGLWGNYYLRYDELNTVISVFAPRRIVHLQELALRAKILSPDLLLLLARTLPRLEKLSLNVLNVAAHNLEDETQAPVTNRMEEFTNARKFADEMRKSDIHEWRLRDIEITISDCFDVKICKRLMRVLAECVPSLQSFDGMDKDGLLATLIDDEPL